MDLVDEPMSAVAAREWRAVKNRWCSYCGIELGDGELTLDHIVPLANGGKGMPYNKVPACGGCNQDKGPESLLCYLMRKPFGEPPPPPGVKKKKRARMVVAREYVYQRLLEGVDVLPQTAGQKRAYVRAFVKQRRRLLTVLDRRYRGM